MVPATLSKTCSFELVVVSDSATDKRNIAASLYASVLETRPQCSDQYQDEDRNFTAKIRHLHQRIATNRLPSGPDLAGGGSGPCSGHGVAPPQKKKNPGKVFFTNF